MRQSAQTRLPVSPPAARAVTARPARPPGRAFGTRVRPPRRGCRSRGRSRGRTEPPAIEVDRVVSRCDTVGSAAECSSPRRSWPDGGSRSASTTRARLLRSRDRELLRTRPSPFTYDQAIRFHGARPAGPTPRPSIEPVSGPAPGRQQRRRHGRRPESPSAASTTVTIYVAETTLTIEPGKGDICTVSRTTTQTVRNIRSMRLRTAAPENLGSPSPITWNENHEHQVSRAPRKAPPARTPLGHCGDDGLTESGRMGDEAPRGG